MDSESFDLIRPYYDSEIKQAVSRILQYDGFRGFLQKFLYGSHYEEGLKIVQNIRTVNEFQMEVSSKFFEMIIAQTIKEFKVNGLENIDKDKRYLFISTHRDIVLDSALLQIALYQHGFETTRSAIGNNLVPSKLLEEVAKMNKMFLVIRDGSVREMLENSLILSSYIRKSILEDNESVWIAQRNGRTKDGNDQTQQGLLKMLAQSNNGTLIGGLKDFNIVPIAISYEYESCDALKARERILSMHGAYKKQPGEDFQSINTGIMQKKGNVEISIGKPINDLLDGIESCRPANDMLKDIAHLIDDQIHEGYRLWKTNYIAADIVTNSQDNQDHYTPEQREEFESYVQQLVDRTDVDRAEFKKVLLGIYANPVFNKLKTHCKSSVHQ
jgi:1-acyl-sn-glycerol-3-phosphate acyltransferase